MRKRNWMAATGLPAVALCLVSLAAALGDDVPTCPDDDRSLPDDAIIRPLPGGEDPCGKATGDCGIAVGVNRLVLTSNCGVQIRCLDANPEDLQGGPFAYQADLVGDDEDTAMFKWFFEDGDVYQDNVFDPRVIWDGYEQRFWVVALEGSGANLDGRIHVAVSAGATPTSVDTSAWYKYTNDGVDDPFDPYQSGLGDYFVRNVSTYPDRTQIAADATNLYVCLRELQTGDQYDDRDMMVVIPKDDMLSGSNTAAIEHMKFIDDGAMDEGNTWGHALAVDYDIDDEATPTVYTVCLPHLTADNSTTNYDSIRFGAFYWDGDSWEYQSTTLSLPTSPNDMRFRGVERSIFGGPGGDMNQIDPSIFWNACTRIVDGTRYVWAVHHVRIRNASSGSPCFAQWYVIQPNDYPSGSPSLVSVGRIAHGGFWRHDPSIAADSDGNMMIHYNRSSDADPAGYPRIYAQAIPAACPTSPPSAVLVRSGPEQVYVPEAGGDVAWIDFSGTAPDANESGVFWGHSQIVYDDGTDDESEQFQTVVSKVNIPSCRPAGDIDGDGRVALDDLKAFQRDVDAGKESDVNGDGRTDIFDFIVLLNATSE